MLLPVEGMVIRQNQVSDRRVGLRIGRREDETGHKSRPSGKDDRRAVTVTEGRPSLIVRVVGSWCPTFLGHKTRPSPQGPRREALHTSFTEHETLRRPPKDGHQDLSAQLHQAPELSIGRIPAPS